MGRERQARRTHMAARGPESADEATETRSSVAERRLVRAAARGVAQPCLGLRFRRGAHP